MPSIQINLFPFIQCFEEKNLLQLNIKTSSNFDVSSKNLDANEWIGCPTYLFQKVVETKECNIPFTVKEPSVQIQLRPATIGILKRNTMPNVEAYTSLCTPHALPHFWLLCHFFNCASEKCEAAVSFLASASIMIHITWVVTFTASRIAACATMLSPFGWIDAEGRKIK